MQPISSENRARAVLVYELVRVDADARSIEFARASNSYRPRRRVT